MKHYAHEDDTETCVDKIARLQQQLDRVCRESGVVLFKDGEVRNFRAEKAEAENERLREQKDGAYAERNKLVAALSKLFPASLERHEESDKTWEDDWRWIVFINLPTGQVSWHIHDSELPLFDHLYRICGRVWDGHTTEEKYRRLAALRAFDDGEVGS